MAKITTKQISINGVQNYFEVHYSQSKGFYLKDFPKEIWTLGTDSGYMGSYMSEDTLYEAVQDALRKYHAVKRQIKKVIRINLILGSHYTMESTGGNGYMGYKNGVDRAFNDKITSHFSSNSPSHGIAFRYDVLFLKSENGNKLYRVGDNDIVGSEVGGDPNKSILLDYSPEREEFMKNIIAGMEGIAEKLIKFFNTAPEELTNKIDAIGTRQFLLNNSQ